MISTSCREQQEGRSAGGDGQDQETLVGWAGAYASDRASCRPSMWKENQNISQTPARHPAGKQGTLSPSNPHPAGESTSSGGSGGAVPASCPPCPGRSRFTRLGW